MPNGPANLIAALADRYRIDREIGQGGMATVYLAHDLKHDRDVALKVLRPDLAATLGPERFLREIQIAARLQHPNILPVHDSGEAAGFLYYVMPFVEGHSLREQLSEHGELPVGEAIRILREVADALAHAHAHGVLHRDIKPENVMLSGRHALVADFGVAKAVREATGRQKLTTVGVALGTPTYMAPEQAAADPHADHRADIYAFGVTAYELLAGRPPFTGITAQAILAAHLTEVPAPVSGLRSSLPQPLAQLVMRCLEKKPADRPQSADELLQALEALTTPSGGVTPAYTQPVTPALSLRKTRRWLRLAIVAVAVVALGVLARLAFWPSRTPAPGPQREPVVVLPFMVQSSDQAVAQLGPEVAEDIAAAIEGNNLARVVRYRPERTGQAFTDQLGRRAQSETGAGTLLTGVIVRRGQAVQVEARLVRGSDLKTIWTLGPEHASAADPDSALDAIRMRALGAVGWYLSPFAPTSPGSVRPPPTLDVLRLVEKAFEFFFAARYTQAVPLFRDAAARDTTWFVPPLWLTTSYFNLSRWQERDSLLAFLQARRERMSRLEALWLDLQQAWLASPEEELRASQAVFAADSPWGAYPAMRASVQARRPKEALRYYRTRDTSTAFGRDWMAWDVQAAAAYHMQRQFEAELALARYAKTLQPRQYSHWEREVRALAGLGRTADIDSIITESHGLETQGAPVWLMNAAALELSLHGQPSRARGYAERTLAGVAQLPDSLRGAIQARNARVQALSILGRDEEVVRFYERIDRDLASRILAMRYRELLHDTAGALALVDSARSRPLAAFAASGWNRKGTSMYYGAQILALLGRREEAVALLREALNNGYRLGPDEPLQWYWAPIKDYPPFQELVRIR